MTESVLETPDIQALRDFKPNLSNLAPRMQARFAATRNDMQDSYKTSGIGNRYGAQRAQDQAATELAGAEGTAMAEGNRNNQLLEMQRLTGLAGLTRSTRRKGYDTAKGGLFDDILKAAGGAAGFFV